MNSLGITGFHDIVVSLLVWIGVHSGYPLPHHVPPVHFVSQEHLRSLACNGGQCPVIAFHHHQRGILLEDSFAQGMGLCELSILLHELVHVVQRENLGKPKFSQVVGGYGDQGDGAEEWIRRENEAYQLQKAFLHQYGRRYRPPEVSYSYNFRPEEGRGHFYASGCRRLPSGPMTSVAR